MRKSKSGLVWIVEKPLKVNTYYGWGWDSSEGRMAMCNLSPKWAKRRMYYLQMLDKSKWWTVHTIMTDLHRNYMMELAHKKRAKWDSSKGVYVYTKGGKEFTL